MAAIERAPQKRECITCTEVRRAAGGATVPAVKKASDRFTFSDTRCDDCVLIDQFGEPLNENPRGTMAREALWEVKVREVANLKPRGSPADIGPTADTIIGHRVAAGLPPVPPALTGRKPGVQA